MSKADVARKRKERLEEQLKAANAALRQAEVAEKKKQTKEQNKKDILYAIYRRTFHAEEYERDIKGPEFDKFLTRDYERAYFDLPPINLKELPSPTPEESTSTDTQGETGSPEYHFEARPEGGAYLDVPKEHKEIAKPFGAKWDATVQKWYAPEGTDPEPIQRAVDEARGK